MSIYQYTIYESNILVYEYTVYWRASLPVYYILYESDILKRPEISSYLIGPHQPLQANSRANWSRNFA